MAKEKSSDFLIFTKAGLMKSALQQVVSSFDGYLELRYHKRQSNSFKAMKGRVDVANHSLVAGVGARVLVDGVWGFASTTDTSVPGIRKAVEAAVKGARALGRSRSRPTTKLRRGRLATFDYLSPGYQQLSNTATQEKLAKVIETERQLARLSNRIQTASCRYNELLEEKVVVTSDGAAASMRIAQPEFVVAAIAEKDGEQMSASRGAGVTAGWDCLFRHPTLQNAVEEAGKLSIDLLDAKYPSGGSKTCILSPAVVGLLCHEAIGHTVEADFVKAGSIAQGKIGQMVASELVNLVDSGCETMSGYAVGNIPFDDEGVITESTDIIRNGKLVSFLHNKETAHEFGVEPTGNARAWLYDDEPLIRMRNTFMRPGSMKLEDMIAGVEDGYLIEGAGSGQADSNGEFMFGCSHVWRISGGKKVELMREATLSGIAFNVLKTVDAVSQEFLWDLGTGHCGKGQPAKVDAGGPYIRCQIHVGGRN
jgi:TldD protein